MQLVGDFFNHDSTKTALWFRTPNPMLGGISPKEMAKLSGQQLDKLLKFVVNCANENKRD